MGFYFSVERTLNISKLVLMLSINLIKTNGYIRLQIFVHLQVAPLQTLAEILKGYLFYMENKFDDIVKKKQGKELLVMVYQFDEWSPEMLKAIEDELERRQMLPNDIAIRKKEIINKELKTLSKGKPASMMGQVFGWIGVLGLLGIIIGYTYSFSKVKSKYTNQKFYKYDEPSRENGTYIFYTSLTVFISYFLYKLITIRGNSF